MALEIINTVISISVKCWDTAQEVKSFKKSSKVLAEKIKFLINPIEMVDEMLIQSAKNRNEYDRFIDALKDLEKCIQDIEKFLSKLKGTSYLEKLIDKNNVTDQFNDFHAILNGLVPGLVLILQLSQQVECRDNLLRLEHNQQAIKDDMANLVSHMEKIMANLKEMQTSLPGECQVPQELKVIRLADFEGMKKHNVTGTFGKLYFATYKPFGEEVAVKILPESKDIKDKLMEEAKLLKKFESPNIVKLWGICTEGTNNMIVFEYMQNGTLRNALDNNSTLTVAQRLRMAIDGALGLYHIHHLGMLHRVLNSNKFLVDQHFKVKLSDVGLSKTFESAQKHSVQTSALQKKYHAPELLNDPKVKYNYKCEIYCFGIVLWEIFTGKVPYKGLSEKEINQMESTGGKLAIDMELQGKLISECMDMEPLLRLNISEIVRKLRAMDHQD